MLKLSIILPCYNVAPFLERCFTSIYSQSIDYDFEVIAVNDASTDNTLEILLYFQSLYMNLRIIDKLQNEKLTAARSSGIQSARGEYILHVDPDDYLLPNTLNSIFKNRGIDWDILFYNVFVKSKNDEFLLYSKKIPSKFNLMNHRDRKKIFSIIKGSCFAKIIKKELLVDMSYFDFNYNIGEDFAFNFEIFNRAKCVAYDPTPMYYYYYNSSSLIRSSFNVERLNFENSWIKNVISVMKKGKFVYRESILPITLSMERYSIGLLLLIRKRPIEEQIELLPLWKEFFSKQTFLYGVCKEKWYNYLLTINNRNIYVPLFLISLGQIDPYVERVNKYAKRVNRFMQK